MNPLSIFPALFTFEIFAPFLLRLVVGAVIILFGNERYKSEYKWSSILYWISGALLILGLYTQIAAIAAILLLRFDTWLEMKKGPVARQYLILDITLSIILVSLLLTGPGAFARDLPL